ncbi:hypothetical protein [Dankookia sp. P2]|uniref:hypothetical protein n=1 Tax=Dankookia sp. P2 TaxID=3423955 RepID=UPI003D67BFDC
MAGWPLRVLAIRTAPPPQDGLVPLGIAMLAMLALAFVAHRRERRALAAAATEERRETLRAAALAESEAQLRLALAAAELGCWSWDEAADRVAWDAQAATILGWCPSGPVGMTALRDCCRPGGPGAVRCDDRPGAAQRRPGAMRGPAAPHARHGAALDRTPRPGDRRARLPHLARRCSPTSPNAVWWRSSSSCCCGKSITAPRTPWPWFRHCCG